jgi:hypothetical protein
MRQNFSSRLLDTDVEVLLTVQWRPSRDASSAASKGSVDTVTARLEASRLADRRHGSSRTHSPIQLPSSSYQTSSYVNPGLLFQDTEDLQIATKHRQRTAGPIPQSWSKDIVNVKKTLNDRRQKRREEQATRLLQGQPSHLTRPATLREECIKRFLVNMAQGGPLLDEVAFLPIHLKKQFLSLAPRLAPLDDAGIDALLLEAEYATQLEGQVEYKEKVDSAEEAEWESSLLSPDLPEERKLAALDLSNSTLTVAMLRQVMLEEHSTQARQKPESTLRLPMLKNLDISSSKLQLSAALISILSHIPLVQLAASNISCNLYLPLQSIALAIPTLEYLDVSHNDWLDWSHLSRLDWATLFPNLRTLNITSCDGLAPSASFLNPEGRPGGPAVVLQAMNTIREAGRVRWLEIIA